LRPGLGRCGCSSRLQYVAAPQSLLHQPRRLAEALRFLEQDLNEAGLAAVPWADSALKPADTQAASDAPVDATTRTEKADVLSS
jgi:hypothetical protein